MRTPSSRGRRSGWSDALQSNKRRGAARTERDSESTDSIEPLIQQVQQELMTIPPTVSGDALECPADRVAPILARGIVVGFDHPAVTVV